MSGIQAVKNKHISKINSSDHTLSTLASYKLYMQPSLVHDQCHLTTYCVALLSHETHNCLLHTYSVSSSTTSSVVFHSLKMLCVVLHTNTLLNTFLHLHLLTSINILTTRLWRLPLDLDIEPYAASLHTSTSYPSTVLYMQLDLTIATHLGSH